MAWIRRVRTPSGATAVQVVESVRGKRRVVKHVGSAHDEVRLGLLFAQAQALIEGSGQGELDLGLPRRVPRAELLPVSAGGALVLDAFPRRREVVAAPVVLATASDTLYQVLAGVYDSLGFDRLGDLAFRDLVVARIVEPTSIADSRRVLADLGRDPWADVTFRRTLDRCVGRSYRDLLADLCFAYARVSGDVSLVLYDVTTLRTQAAKEDSDGLRKVGYSKERSIDPQIVVGLLVDRTGFPLEVGVYEGNKAEKATIVPIVEAFKSRHGIEAMVVAADAGMLSAANLKRLDDAGFHFIVGSRMTKAPIDLESHFRWHGDAFTDSQVIDTVTPRHGRNRDNDPLKRAEPVWSVADHPGSWRAIWAYSAARFAHDNKTINAQEAKARAVAAGDRAVSSPRFVKTKDGTKVVDEKTLARARQLAGLKGYVTNVPATVMGPTEVIAHYHELWHVEQSFRFTKHDLAARPFFVRTRDAIDAHITVVFAALAISREIYARTGITPKQLVKRLRELRSATISLNGTVQTLPPNIDQDTQDIIDALVNNSRN